MLKSSESSLLGTQDQSYSPQTFDTLDYKANSPGSEDQGKPRSLPIANASRLGVMRRWVPTFPAFPTIFELAKTMPEPAVKKDPPGLFETYLGKDPTHILQDSQTEEHYDSRALSLLADLQQGSKTWAQLTPAERGLLDEATLDYYHPPKKLQVSSSLAPGLPTVRTQGGELPKVTPVEGPVMDAFWWT